MPRRRPPRQGLQSGGVPCGDDARTKRNAKQRRWRANDRAGIKIASSPIFVIR
jgi:hypothetical protein